MSENTVKCSYCGTAATLNVQTHRVTCECRRLHEYQDFSGKKYNVLYKKDGTKEVIK